jgi:hypothetical protein
VRILDTVKRMAGGRCSGKGVGVYEEDVVSCRSLDGRIAVQMRPTTVSKETYYSVKRDLNLCLYHRGWEERWCRYTMRVNIQSVMRVVLQGRWTHNSDASVAASS